MRGQTEVDLDLYSYQDFREFLRDYYNTRRNHDRKFSIRFFARKAGLKSENYLKVVMDGRRSLTPRNIPKFAKGLGLSNIDAEYFEALVLSNQARDNIEMRMYQEKLALLRRKKSAVVVKSHQLDFFNSWYNIVIFEMAGKDDFNPDPEYISRRLRRRVTPEEAKSSIELMCRLGLLKQDPETKKWMAVAPQIASPEEIPKDTLKRLHQKFIEFAVSSMEGQTPEVPEIRSLTISLAPDQVNIFRSKLKEFQRELNSVFSSNKGGEVYQLNIQFYTLTSPSKK